LVFATDYPLLNIFWTILIVVGFVVWIWILFIVFGDIFRRRDTSGFMKVLWIIFLIVLPYFGVFVYLIANHNGMNERAAEQQQQMKAQLDDYMRTQIDPAEQIAKGKSLLDQGAISQAEFDQIKQKALGN
jgi:hypothetical protein